MRTLLNFLLSLACLCSQAATYYVDSSVSSSGNGQSWGTAWKGIPNITGVSAGDTVYFSGGPSGSTRTYSVSNWSPTGGSSMSARVTYTIGQDSSHNGTAIFDCGGNLFLSANSYIVISGDAGDGNRHFALSNPSAGTIFWIGSAIGVRISYINMGNIVGGSTGGETPVRMDSPSTFELDNCYAYMTGDYCDGFAYTSVGMGGSTWDDSRFHNNVIYLPNWNTSSAGPDCFQVTGTGFSCYSNTIVSYATQTYNSDGSTAQHQDGFQFLWGSYIKIYDNLIMDMGNSAMEAGAMYGDCNHVLIYNNVVALTYPRYSSTRGFECRTYGNGYFWRDTHILNNTFVNFNYETMSPWGVTCQPVGCVNMNETAEYSGCSADNNLAINYKYSDPSAAFSLGGTGISSANNTVQNTFLDTYFANYFGMVSNQVPNVRLTAGGNSALRIGTNESSYFSTDKDGNPRPLSSAWTVGAYECGSVTTNPLISVSPGSLDFGVVAANVTNDMTVTVKNVGAGTLAGTATVPAPFSIISGASYSLGANQSQTVSVRYRPTAAGNSSTNVTFTGGGGAVVPVRGTAYAILPGMSFAADAGVISSPFVSSNGIVSQSVNSGVSDGGRALYAFSLAIAGDYAFQAVTEAPSTAENSFYVNIDADPTDPYMIWNVPLTRGFQTSFVSWQGNGTWDAPEIVPKVFSLTAGTHQLIIRGREPNTQLQSISIVKKASSPTGLHVVSSQ